MAISNDVRVRGLLIYVALGTLNRFEVVGGGGSCSGSGYMQGRVKEAKSEGEKRERGCSKDKWGGPNKSHTIKEWAPKTVFITYAGKFKVSSSKLS